MADQTQLDQTWLGQYTVLIRERDALRADYDRLKDWAEAIGRERDGYRAEAQALRAENEQLRHDLREALGVSVAYEQKLTVARAENNALHAEVERLRAQNDELHRQIDYVRSLAWDDISDDQIVINLRHMLDRPKGLERPNCW